MHTSLSLAQPMSCQQELTVYQNGANTSAALFSKKHEQAEIINFMDVVLAKQAVASAIEPLKQDGVIDKILNAWHFMEQHRPEFYNLPLVDVLYETFKKGTCNGQTMKILELVSSHDRTIITEDWLYQNLNLKDFLRYHTLHHLHVFVRSQSCNDIWGVPTKVAEEKIGQLLSYHNKNGISSEVIHFTDFEKEGFICRFSDFIKKDIRIGGLENNVQDFVIEVAFGRDQGMGHVASMYYGATQKRYFWYDSCYYYGGLFSTTDHKTFLQGVADRLLEFKNDQHYHFSYFHLTAYSI